MPSRLQHLSAARRRLGAVMAAGPTGLPPASALGLDADAVAALCFARHPADAGAACGLTLGFDPRVGARCLPTWVRSPLDGERIPVRAWRVDAPATAHGWMRARNDSNHFLDGSLGAILRLDADPERLLALTAGHVCGASRAAGRGDRLHFENAGAGPSAAFDGELLDWQPNFVRLQAGTPLDAGIAEVQPEQLERFAVQSRHWPVGVAQAQVADALRLRTRDLEIAGRGFAWIDVVLNVQGDPSRRYTLRNAMAWRPSLPTQGGDSGAPLWNDSEQIVAIHAGGNDLGDAPWAYAVPIGRILAWAGASIVRRGEPLRPATPALQAPPPAVADLPAPAAAPLAVAARAADILARTLYGEARGEGARGLEAVAHVVLNRVDARRWWGRDVEAACLKPWQFSCWNPSDPNRRKLLELTAADPIYAQAFGIAAELLDLQEQDHAARLRRDLTAGATHYFAPARVRQRPAWAVGRVPCARIGGHEFYRDVA